MIRPKYFSADSSAEAMAVIISNQVKHVMKAYGIKPDAVRCRARGIARSGCCTQRDVNEFLLAVRVGDTDEAELASSYGFSVRADERGYYAQPCMDDDDAENTVAGGDTDGNEA